MKVLWKISLHVICYLTTHLANAQLYRSSHVHVDFLSESMLENIEANNNVSTAVINEATSEITLIVKIKDFQFTNALQQEHFNENYMESEKFPLATFSGKILAYSYVKENEEREFEIEGKLTIHGVSKAIRVLGKIKKCNKELIISSSFKVKTQDYDIKIPKLLWQNIAEEIIITIQGVLK